MRYYKIIDESGIITAIGTNDSRGIEITSDEYDTLLAEIKKQADLANHEISATEALSIILGGEQT